MVGVFRCNLKGVIMKDNILLFLISGRARNGKGTVSKILKEKLEDMNFKVCEIQVMRTLKGYLKDYFGWDGTEEAKPRKVLQQIGTDIIREKMDKPYFHIDRLTEDINVLANFFNVFIINDIRLPLEIETLKERYNNVICINVTRKDYVSPLDVSEQVHITELALNDYKKFDYELVNSSLNGLEDDIIKIIDSEVIKNEIHD